MLHSAIQPEEESQQFSFSGPSFFNFLRQGDTFNSQNENVRDYILRYNDSTINCVEKDNNLEGIQTVVMETFLFKKMSLIAGHCTPSPKLQ